MRLSTAETVRHVFFAGLLLASTLTALACSTLPVSRTMEPQVIVVRNRSNTDIATVTLRETNKSPAQAARFGSLSPVPAGVSQSYTRPKNPPRFPSTVTLEWIDSQGRTHSRDLSVTEALRSATGGSDEALVFEIGPYDDVLVFVEVATQSAPSGVEPGMVLGGGPWLLLELNGTIVQLPADERQPFITFQLQGKRATGYSGCNEFFGSYDLKGDMLTFGSLSMTRRFCTGTPGNFEQAFLEVLLKTRRWRIEERVLLFLAEDQVIARFRQDWQRTTPR